MAEAKEQGMDIVQVVQSATGLAGGGRLLFRLLLDDSTSIRRNHSHVINGYNECVDVLTKAPGKVRIATDFFNNSRQTGYVTPSEVVPITAKTYPLSAGTPLFLRSFQTFQDVLDVTNDHPEDRTMNFIFSDGFDTRSHRYGVNASHVKELVVPMFKSGRHVVGAFAVSDGYTDFRQVFADMGIPPQWIKVLRDWEEVRSTMSNIGETTSRSSRSNDDFTTTSKTGF